MIKVALALSLGFAVAVTPAGAQGNAPAASLLARASAYVDAFMQDFSTVVAEERYVQDSRPLPQMDAFGPGGGVTQAPPQHVELRSDLLFVRPDPWSNWLTFRDVFSVNGRAVRDRVDRLTKLFVSPAPGAVDAIDRAWAIARDGYRFNIGSRERNVADPLVALAFLQAHYRQRFEFRVDRIDTSRGPDVWMLKFKERIRPTILRSAGNRDVVSSGRFWIDGESGRVLQTELETSAGDRVMTTFTFDERLGIDVPAEMRDLSWHDGTVVTGVATYANFRQFDVQTDEKFR
jgi:hypothetical protein